MKSDLFAGFIRIHILYHASKGRVYGSWLMEELGRHGYRVGCGTLYPLLHRLLEDGYLGCKSEKVGGNIRKYYRITAKGRRAVAEARVRIRELISELEE